MIIKSNYRHNLLLISIELFHMFKILKIMKGLFLNKLIFLKIFNNKLYFNKAVYLSIADKMLKVYFKFVI